MAVSDPQLAKEKSSSSEERIRVLVRVRPLLRHEYAYDVAVDVHNKKVNLQCGESTAKTTVDATFDDTANQEQVFAEITDNVEAVFKGMNSSVMAYGMTGTGKTFTMLGKEMVNREGQVVFDMTGAGRGIIPRVTSQLLAQRDAVLKTEDVDSCTVSCSYMQVYAERLYDLLHPLPEVYEWNQMSSRDPRRLAFAGLEIKADKRWGVKVPTLSSVQVESVDDVLEVIRLGASHRALRSTDHNDVSSRSHSILQFFVEQEGQGVQTYAKMSLVDLAGSEKWVVEDGNPAEMSPEHVAELKAINGSLSHLGKCIIALTQRSMTASRNQHPRSNSQQPPAPPRHIPFRDSKLTHLLHDSIGLHARSVIVVTLSPSSLSSEGSKSCLKFADAARRVMVTARVQVEQDLAIRHARAMAEVERLKGLLKKLTSQHSAQRSGGGGGEDNEEDVYRLQQEREKLMQELQHSRKQLRQAMSTIEELQAKMDDPSSLLSPGQSMRKSAQNDGTSIFSVEEEASPSSKNSSFSRTSPRKARQNPPARNSRHQAGVSLPALQNRSSKQTSYVEKRSISGVHRGVGVASQQQPAPRRNAPGLRQVVSFESMGQRRKQAAEAVAKDVNLQIRRGAWDDSTIPTLPTTSSPRLKPRTTNIPVQTRNPTQHSQPRSNHLSTMPASVGSQGEGRQLPNRTTVSKPGSNFDQNMRRTKSIYAWGPVKPVSSNKSTVGWQS